jgi:hypothetical protein
MEARYSLPVYEGDIASTAELRVYEPNDGVVHLPTWRPFDQDAVSRPAVPAPAREKGAAARGGTIVPSRSGGEQLPEAAEQPPPQASMPPLPMD